MNPKDKEEAKRVAVAKKAVKAIEAELKSLGYGILFTIADNQGGYTTGQVGNFSIASAIDGALYLSKNTIANGRERDPVATQKYLAGKQAEEAEESCLHAGNC